MPNIAKIYTLSERVTPVVIKENSGSNLSNYAVAVSLGSSWDGWSYVRSDGSDIHFIDANGNPLYFWIENFDYSNKKALIWVKIPSLAAGSTTVIYLVYGGVNPYTIYRNPRQVFPFYYDWVGATSVGWGVNNPSGSASASVYNNMLKLYAPSYTARINVYYAYTVTNAGYALRLKAYKDTSSDGWIAGFGDGTIAGSGNDEWCNGYIYDVARDGNARLQIRKSSNCSFTSLAYTSFSISANTVYVQEARWAGSTLIDVVFSSDGVSQLSSVSASDTTYTSQSYIQIGNDIGNLYVMWVLLRPYVSSEPTVTVLPSSRIISLITWRDLDTM